MCVNHSIWRHSLIANTFFQNVFETCDTKKRQEWRSLLRSWHPDKNPEKAEVATAVFQFLQKAPTERRKRHKDTRIEHRECRKHVTRPNLMPYIAVSYSREPCFKWSW